VREERKQGRRKDRKEERKKVRKGGRAEGRRERTHSPPLRSPCPIFDRPGEGSYVRRACPCPRRFPTRVRPH
jgi:hypothetical protein